MTVLHTTMRFIHHYDSIAHHAEVHCDSIAHHADVQAERAFRGSVHLDVNNIFWPRILTRREREKRRQK